ncbi:MAG: alkaline phosphatase, partial [Kiritimatiellaeota bacterium]|nr:alkaline phosphatase [Kiritimatiellota bacterium]
MKRLLAISLAVIVCHGSLGAPPKNIILMIGDGMGFSIVKVVEDAQGSPLAMTDLPYRGTVRTAAAGGALTDSASAATAIACGVKTDPRMLGMTPDGERRESMAERFRRDGKKVGLLTTVHINDATPAGFYAHVASRASLYAIGKMALESGFEILGGSELAEASPAGETSLWDIAATNGYAVVRSP